MFAYLYVVKIGVYLIYLRAWIIVTSKDVIRLTSNGLTLQTSVYKKCSRERNASGVSDLTTVKLSKTFVSEVKGSMNIFSAMGPTAATWKVVEGQQAAVFGTDEMAITDTPSLMHDISNSAATNALKNVTITRQVILISKMN